jgi:hypothetical protein
MPLKLHHDRRQAIGPISVNGERKQCFAFRASRGGRDWIIAPPLTAHAVTLASALSERHLVFRHVGVTEHAGEANHRFGPVDRSALVKRCEFGSHGFASLGKPVIVLSPLEQRLQAAQLLYQRLSRGFPPLGGPNSGVTFRF